MDFDLSEEHRMLKTAFRKFAEQEIAPLVEEAERLEKFPVSVWRRAGELGYTGLMVSEEHGGSGAGLLSAVLFAEEVGRVNAGIATAMVCPYVVLPVLEQFGTEYQKQRFLTPGVKGEAIMAMALTEPSAGSDLRAVQTTARKDDDAYIINGTKTFITNPSIADWMLTLVYADKSAGLKGTRLAIIEPDMKGVSIKRLSTTCSRSSEVCEVSLDDVRVPIENMLGGDTSFRDAIDLFECERCYLSGRTLGLAQAAYEAAFDYAREREAFGQPIADFQAIGFKVTNMAMQLEAARLLTYYAAWLHDQGRPFVKEASMAKIYTAEVADRVCYDAMHIHGAYGLSVELPVERYWRDSGVTSIGGGTSEMQHIRIARELGLTRRRR